MRQVQPTIFLGVPRVWEKMQERMVSVSKTQWMFQRKIAQVAKWIGYWGNISRMNGYVADCRSKHLVLVLESFLEIL